MGFEHKSVLYSANREIMRKVFPWDGDIMHTCCAVIYAASGRAADSSRLSWCRDLLKEHTGVFSHFRSSARSPIVCMLAQSQDPEDMLQKGIDIYQLLKKDFWSNTYLPMTAMILAEMAQPGSYEEAARRTRRIYEGMKADHRFLTGGEDSTFCAMMALSDRTDADLLRDMETSFRILKPHFFSGNAVQALSSVLSLGGENPEEVCGRTLRLFDAFREAGRKYGTSEELPTLGLLAMLYKDPQEAVCETMEADAMLAGCKGFGPLSAAGKKQRLMYAGILAASQKAARLQEDAASSAALDDGIRRVTAVNATLAILLARQAAMVCAVSAATTSSSAASSSSS